MQQLQREGLASMPMFFKVCDEMGINREEVEKNHMLQVCEKNASLTLIQGNECFVLKRKLKIRILKFLSQNYLSRGNFIRGNRLRAFPKLENAFLTLIQGN
jgi:hypothetical protein